MTNRGTHKVVDLIITSFYMTRRAPVGVGWVVCVGVLHGGLYCLCICLPDLQGVVHTTRSDQVPGYIEILQKTITFNTRIPIQH